MSAKIGNAYAIKPEDQKKSNRRMVNLTDSEVEAIDKEIAKTGTTWAKWSRAVIRQAVKKQ